MDHYFTNPAFSGWRGQPCSICSKEHPGPCDTVNRPEFQEALVRHGRLIDEDPDMLRFSKNWIGE
jgi:hypothetical protein